MRTLYLLRHAKSSWDDPALQDFDRPLAPRGIEASRRMGEHMHSEGVAPELVLCSPAVRARQTLEGLGDGLGSPRVEFDEDIYDAEGSDLLTAVHGVAPETELLMLVGHNPSIQLLTLLLCAEGERLDDVRSKYPTGALATLAVEAPEWSRLRTGGAELAAFVKPRELL